jgi:RimJ/RimL family protein N-acetyltransferase
MHTPGFPVFLTATSNHAAAELGALLASARPQVPGINAEPQAAEAFAETWRQRTGHEVTVHRRMRLHCLGTLVWPDPVPEGRPRVADQRDRDLLTEWFGAFAVEVNDAAAADHSAAVDERLGYGGITVWEAGGVPVSIAGVTRAVRGMIRVGPVYTPPALRSRGYAGGATAAVSRAALDAGATQVVLYTDLANPTSNALYERLGYRAVEDRVVLTFAPHHPVAR